MSQVQLEKNEYRAVDGTLLQIKIYKPADWKKTDKRPCIVFFFGGGWIKGNPDQFEPQCQYLALRGMVAFTVDYRVKERNGTVAYNCDEDGKAVILWIRERSCELGIDPDKVTAGGGSAGGQIALAAALCKGFGELDVGSVPNALVLFNPVVDTTTGIAAEKFGDKAYMVSPLHHVIAGAPPAIIFHGTSDSVVLFSEVQTFTKEMIKHGNNCKLIAYDGREHGFFNCYHYGNPDYFSTLEKTDLFLASLGYLTGDPVVKTLSGDPTTRA